MAVLPATVVLLFPSNLPRWAYMWSLAFAIYCGCKWLTWRRSWVNGISHWKHAGYLLLWPGLDARSFLDPRANPPKPRRKEWWLSGGRLALGMLLLFGLARYIPPERLDWIGWSGMFGIILILHFGSFHLLSCAWRHFGVDARPLMNRPLASASLSEFWGRRWNTAFRDLTHRFLFRPLTSRFNASIAVLAGFTFSGLVHDVVISLPARGGYGGPTVFFLVQGIGLLAERSRIGRRLGLGTGWRGWLFAMTVLLVPLALLFHRPFVREVVVPFMHAIGGV